MVGVGFVAVLFGMLFGLLGSLAARAVVARSFGVRGWRPIFAFDQKPWAMVSVGRRALFSLSGPVGVYLVAAFVSAMGFVMGGEAKVDESSMRVTVRPSTPAMDAGIRDGDQIIAVGGASVSNWDALRTEVAKHADEPTPVVVRRGDQTLTLTATPNSSGKLGVSPPIERARVGVVSAFGKGLAVPVQVLGSAVRGFGRTLAGRERAEFTGPVGIAAETGKTQQSGFGQLLLLLGALMSYFLLVPALILGLVFFPRSRSAA